ncbi:hypothetical protein [Arsenophonus apicola]|uniref:hypothetical protein n=1 Tax=Arsenophonus apicola TaxID=2879119 RepID=UPI00387A57EA
MIQFKDFMKLHRLTNNDVAKAFGITPQMVSQWRNDARLFVDEKNNKIIRITVVKDRIKEILNLN